MTNSRIRYFAAPILLVLAAVVCGCDSSSRSPTEPETGIVFTPDRAPAANSVVLQSSGSTNDTLSVEIFASDVNDAQTLAIAVAYPNGLLRFDGYQSGDFLEPSFPLVVTALNLVFITQPRVTLAGASGSGSIGTLQFTALEGGAGRIEFRDPDLFDSAGNSIPGVDWISGDVQVFF